MSVDASCTEEVPHLRERLRKLCLVDRLGYLGLPGNTQRAWPDTVTELLNLIAEEEAFLQLQLDARVFEAVSYTHLTLPTIYSV